MSGNSANSDPLFHESWQLRFRIVHILYAIALLASSLGTFGLAGLAPGLFILATWAFVFLSSSRLRAFRIACAILLVGMCGLMCIWLPPVQSAREASRRTHCMVKVKQIMLALHNYHDTYKSLPPAYIADENGKPKHSWRVLILPFIDCESLYDAYNFDEPWDGPNNRKLAKQIPNEYSCPSCRERGDLRASYSAVVSPQCAWPRAKARSFGEILDGPSNTVFVIEADPRGVNWMEPRDLTYDEAIRVLSTSTPDDGHVMEDFFYEIWPGRNIGFGDASVHFFSHGLSEREWAEMIKIDDGKRFIYDGVNWDVQPPKRLKTGNCLRLAMFVVVVLFPLPWVWIDPHGQNRSSTPIL